MPDLTAFEAIQRVLDENQLSSRSVASRDGSRLINTCSAGDCDWICAPDGYQGERHQAHIAQAIGADADVQYAMTREAVASAVSVWQERVQEGLSESSQAMKLTAANEALEQAAQAIETEMVARRTGTGFVPFGGGEPSWVDDRPLDDAASLVRGLIEKAGE